jgi:hypothetical protein
MAQRIKDTYQKYLWIFIAFNIILFWSILAKGFFSIAFANDKLSVFFDVKSILFILSPIISLILSSLLSNSIKEVLVFWRVRDRLPGCRAFTCLIKKDTRIDCLELERLVGSFPDDPAEQNRLWYKFYKGCEDDKIVIGSHRDFLLTRDLCSISFLLIMILLPISLMFFQNNVLKISYSLFLVVQYLVLSIASKNFGNRFACNVLAITSNKKIS